MPTSRLSQPFTDWLAASHPGAGHGTLVAVDAVVIGSGYGGAVAALRLAQQGWSVLVLERGAEFQPGDFPNHLGQLPKFLRAHGLDGTVGSLGGVTDLRLGLGMGAVVANGLGGGSLINAGVMMRPDADVFAQQAWPAEIRHDLDRRFATPAGTGLGLEAAFERADAHLRGEWFDDRVTPSAPRPVPPYPDPPPVSHLRKARALQRMGRAMKERLLEDKVPDFEVDYEARPARVTIDLEKCKRCGDCFSGCNVPGAKKTLLTNYLHDAHALGATLLTEATVYSIRPAGPPAAQQWHLRVLPTATERNALKLKDAVACEGYTLCAKLVVVAAGTFGSTELLQRSQELHNAFTLSPALGTRLSGNGDSLSALADIARPVDGVGHGADAGLPDVGPTITTLLDLRQRPEIDQRVVIQEGAVPGAWARIFAELLATTWTLHHLGTTGRAPKANAGLEPLAATLELARHTQLLLAMGHDGSKGRIVWMPAMDGAVPFWPQPEDEPVYRRQQQLFDAAVGGADGGVHLHPPTWRLVRPELARAADGVLPPSTALSVHPLGGCPMGDHFETGVVDHRGQVWRAPSQAWNNLYVLDGSIVPTSLGCNPLWTITALAERAMAWLKPLPPARGKHPAPPAAQRYHRAPRATERQVAPRIRMDVLERLEIRRLEVRGALRAALGADFVESDIDLSLGARDWFRVWERPEHRVQGVTGKLRLVVPPPPAGRPPANLVKLEYKVTRGAVELFSPEFSVARTLFRVLRLPRILVTWAVLRGRRDLDEESRRPRTIEYPYKALLALGWAASELRYVRYDLRLQCQPGPGAALAPPQLLLKGEKKIVYAATWGEIACYFWQRWTAPGSRLPGDLRASLLHQLTQPTIRLDTSRSAQRWPRRWTSVAHARYDFDEQSALQRSPARVHGGADTTMAGLAALAYPAFVVRYLLQSRLLDFRLPTYSDAPAIDAASTQDVVLRIRRKGGQVLIDPQEFSLEVPLGLSSSDDGTEPPAGSKVRLRLWRYARRDRAGQPRRPQCKPGTWCGEPVRRARTVLLMHAFDMSGLSFTFKTTAQNFAEHLYQQGWEVWILDSRMSPRTRASIEPCTIDELGFIDAPRAVDFILGTLRKELGAGAPLQISGFGQCMGAAALQIGLLGGRLSYPIEAGKEYASSTGVRPLMPKLAGLVTSQTHAFIVGSRSAQSKTWVPPLLRDWAGRTMVPLGVRGPVLSPVESLADRLFAGLPVPPGERCHGEGELHRIDDDCATCRRIRFLLGSMFLHANLNLATHKELPRLFGAGSVRLFAQGAKFFLYEKLCSEDGHNVYATDEAMSRHLALPLRFLHGEHNGLFDAESATRSSEQYRRVHPRWADRYGLPTAPGRPRQVCDVIEGFSHVDVLIGEKAMEAPAAGQHSVYGRLSRLLDDAWRIRDAAPARAGNQVQCLVVRFPRSGPFIGPVVELPAAPGQPARRVVGISFIVDDTYADAPLAAVALVDPPLAKSPRQLVELAITEMKVAVPARDNQFHIPGRRAYTGLRAAHGQIELPALPPGQDLVLRCVSYAITTDNPMRLLGGPQGHPWQGTLQDVQGIVRLGAAAGPGVLRAQNNPPVTVADIELAIQDAHARVRALRAASLRPFPPTLSQRLRYPRDEATTHARLPAHALQPLANGDRIRIAVGCCRYNGFPFERNRTDDAFYRLLKRMAASTAAKRPQALFMVGDQIYADRTAGLVDSLSPVERFFSRHHEAFSTDAARRLYSSLPTVCTPDDHEFIDAYPLGRPLMRRGPDAARPGLPWPDARELAARKVAQQAIEAYQLGQLPESARQHGYCAFQRGEVRFFVLDTRTRRERLANGEVRTTSAAARWAFRRWLREAGPCDLCCLVTGSVLLPGLYPGADPANMGPVDTMQAAPRERAWLLAQLARKVPGRFVLLSGDYHVTFAGQVWLDGQVVGAAIVAPPFYAPLIYANATPGDLWLKEPVKLRDGGVVTVKSAGRPARTGSGYGLLDFQRLPTGWRVRLVADLIDFEQPRGRRWVKFPSIPLGPAAAGPACGQAVGPAPAATPSPAVQDQPRDDAQQPVDKADAIA